MLLSRFTFYVWLLTVWLWWAQVWISVFILLGICWVSWIYMLKFFIKLGKLLDTIFFSNILPYPFSDSSCSETIIIHRFVCWMAFYRSLCLCLAFVILHSFYVMFLRLKYLNQTLFMFPDSSASSNLLWSSINEIFYIN